MRIKTMMVAAMILIRGRGGFWKKLAQYLWIIGKA